MSTSSIREEAINIIAEGTRIEGGIVLDQISRIHGVIQGEVRAKDGSTIILGETGVIEGAIHADVLLVEGYVRGNITSRKKVLISGTGRVLGNIQAPVLEIEPGAFFEGECVTGEGLPRRE